MQDSSEDDGKVARRDVPVAFGSRSNSKSESESKGDDSESGGDAGKAEDAGKKTRKTSEKEVKSDKEKIKAATMTTPKKVRFRLIFL